MSMNLNATDKQGNPVHLWQTPTWVSYMCIESWKKAEDGDPKNRHWKDTRKIYLDWCYSYTQGVFYSDGTAIRKVYQNHKDYIMSLGKLKFWVM